MAVDINISNYESFLCSYIDGELTQEELTALEAFLQQYPAIRQELELLDNVRLQPDEEVVFENRASLYKGIKVDEDITTMMLSYIDNELDITKRAQLEVYLDNHPESRRELQQLRAAKLDPTERISFGDKQVLYRQHQKPVRRIAVWWGAAAAVVAGILIWTMPFSHPDTASKHATLADNVKRTIPAKTNTVLPATQEHLAVADPTESNITAGYNEPVKKTVTNRKPAENQASDVKKEVVEGSNMTSAAKSESPASPQFPPPRNTSQEIVEKQVAAIPQPATTLSATVADKPTAKEHVIASTVPVTTDAAPAITSHPAEGIKGELIMSVSGSDSKILDKVTNVAKFFSRKRNK